MSIKKIINTDLNNKKSKCYNCEYGVLCPVLSDGDGHFYPMFGEPIGDCQNGKDKELINYNKGMEMLMNISKSENRTVNAKDIDNVMNELGLH